MVRGGIRLGKRRIEIGARKTPVEETLITRYHHHVREKRLHIMKPTSPDKASPRDKRKIPASIDLDRARLMFEEYHIRAEKLKNTLSVRREDSA